MSEAIITLVENAWENRQILQQEKTKTIIRQIIDDLDKGKLRVAEKLNTEWKVNEWIKKAIVLYFIIQETKIIECGPFEFHDKIALKKNYEQQDVRVVPHAIARYGSYLGKDVILMPSCEY